MLILKIFKLNKLYKEFRTNPSQTTANELKDMAKEIAIVPFVIFGAILILFFILGFTNLIFNSLLFFRILFIIGTLSFIATFIAVRLLLAQIFETVKSISSKILEK